MNFLPARLLGGLLLAPALAFAQAPFTYTIKGQAGQLDAPAKIYLLHGMTRLDSATLHHGAFAFKGTTALPMQAELVVERQGRLRQRFPISMNRTQLFLEPDPITVTTPDSLPHATLKGGRLTADFQQLRAQEQPVMQKMMALGPKGTPEQFAALNQEFDQVDYAFIKAHPGSWVSLENLQASRMELPQYPVVAPLYAGLSAELKNSAPGREYAAMLQRMKAVAVGEMAPAFTQPTPEGKPVSLADYRGKYVLLEFWASWCKPCRAENPAMRQTYDLYKGRNFEVLGVSLDAGKANWVQAIADDHLPWPQVSDLNGPENQAAQRYNVHAIPQNFLLDPTGRIVAVNLKGAELNTTLARLLK